MKSIYRAAQQSGLDLSGQRQMSVQKSRGLRLVLCHIFQPCAPKSTFSGANLLCGLWGSPGTKITQLYLNPVSQSWDLTSTHHLLCLFSNKTVQKCGTWRMLWLNPQWKHFRYNIDATQISRDFHSPALSAALLPHHEAGCVSRLGFRLQCKRKAIGVGWEISVFLLSPCTVSGHTAGGTEGSV